MNHDGLSDLAVLTEWTVGVLGNISVFYGRSGGGFSPETVWRGSVVRFPAEALIADVSGDGLDDIVFLSGLKELAVVRQDAAGALATTPDRYELPTRYWPQVDAFAVGDVDGDGRNDVVAVDPSRGLIVLLQRDDGLLASATQFDPGFSTDGIEIADVDGDGIADLLGDTTTYPSEGHVFVWRRTDDGALAPAIDHTFQTQSAGGTVYFENLALGDVTGDGRPDAVVTWSDEGIWVLPGTRP